MALVKTRNKVSGPAQITPLDRDVIVLRKVNWKKIPGGIYQRIADAQLQPGISEVDMPWFRKGYIANDQPRSAAISEFIIRNTIGFAIARTDTGEFIRKGKIEDLETFDQAVARARVQVAIEVNLDDDEDEEDLDTLDDDDDDEELENLDDEE